MTTTQLAGSWNDARPEGTDMDHVSAAPTPEPTAHGLVFDSTMEGLTLDEVAVVVVVDRPVLVPLSRAQASDAGFQVVEVDDAELLGLGVLPRRPPAPIVPPAPTVAAAPPAAPAAPSPTPAVSTPSAPIPTPAEYTPRHSAAATTTSPTSMDPVAPPVASPVGLPSFDAATPVARSFDEVPVAPARPINSMTASHRDWEPEALAWPYIDRRTASEPVAAVDPAVVPVPRSLSSGRPVNVSEPAELIVRFDAEPRPEIVVDVHGLTAQTVRPLTMQVRAGTFVVLAGGRGSGKSSVLRVLAGLDAPTGGMGRVDGLDLHSLDDDERAEREAISAGYVPQSPFLVPDLTVVENVELPLLADGVGAAMARGAAETMIRSVGLGSHTHAPSEVLSGAEVRLAAVARALVTQDRIVFVDEPIAGLSDDDARVVLDLFIDLVARGSVVVMVCTDPRVRLLGVRHLVFEQGTIVRDDVATTL